MRAIDADALIGELHTTYLYDDNARKVIYRKIEEQPTVGGWISVKERLPEKPGRYLCWFGKNTFAVGASIVPYIPDLHWFASLESLERYENVTHWMPIEPPKKENPSMAVNPPRIPTKNYVPKRSSKRKEAKEKPKG